jgi:serine protease Do
MTRRVAAFLSLLFVGLPSSRVFAQASTDASLVLQSRVVDLFARHRTAIVRVKATRETRDGKKIKRSLKMGTGFFVSNEGHVLTSALLRSADRVWVEFDGNFFLSDVIGEDLVSNVSMLKVKNLPEKFSFVVFGEPVGIPSTGSFALALTSALEFQPAPALGIVQGSEPSFGSRLFPTRMMRTSISVGPGEVGAPVLDLNGKFIGLTYASLPDLRSSFVLPAKACARIRDDLLLTGKVTYAWFGVKVVRKVNAQNGFDVIVEGSVDGSPAASSDLRKGDRLVRIGDSTIRNRGDVAHSAFYARPGQFVTFVISRDGKELEVPIRVSSRPLPPEPIPNEQSEIAEVEAVVPDKGDSALTPDDSDVPDGNVSKQK